MTIPKNTWVKIQKLTPEGPVIVPRLVVEQVGPREYLIDNSMLPLEENLLVIPFDRILQIMPAGWHPGL